MSENMGLKTNSCPVQIDKDSHIFRDRNKLPNLKAPTDEGCWWRRKEVDFKGRKDYVKELDALVDLKKQQRELLISLEEEEDDLRDNPDEIHNKLLLAEKLKERSRSDDSFLNYIKTMNKPKPVPKNVVWRSPGGCGDPVVNSNGEKLTRRTKLFRAISFLPTDEKLFSLSSASELDLVESRRSLPGSTDDSLKRYDSMGKSLLKLNPHQVKFADDYRSLAMKKNLLKELEDEISKAKQFRKNEEAELKHYNEATSEILDKGKVGKPYRDLNTGFIIPEKRYFTDITYHLQNQRDIKKPASYIKDLKEMAEERHRKKQEDRNKTIKKENEHIATFKTYFDKPGNGAPCLDGVMRRKFSECSLRVHKGKMGSSVKSHFPYSFSNTSNIASNLFKNMNSDEDESI